MSKDCEVMFLDEATADLMDIDDWKVKSFAWYLNCTNDHVSRMYINPQYNHSVNADLFMFSCCCCCCFFALKLVTQGGWTANDTKYRSAKGFVNRIPMLITCQTPMDFGKNHNAAMDSRLTKYTFKTLPSVDPTAIAWLEKHPMDCIHWAATQISGLPRSTGVETPVTSAGELDEEEIKELFQFNLDEDLAADPPASPLQQASLDDSCTMESEPGTGVLEYHLGLARKGSLESRQLTELLQTRDRERERWRKESAEKAISRYFSLSSLKRTVRHKHSLPLTEVEQNVAMATKNIPLCGPLKKHRHT